jgi:hypothetical protein
MLEERGGDRSLARKEVDVGMVGMEGDGYGRIDELGDGRWDAVQVGERGESAGETREGWYLILAINKCQFNRFIPY